MTDILTEIIACKQIEIELQKAAISKEMLINNCNEPMPRISMRASLASSPYGIISEFKRRSPSKGWIKEDAQADTIPPAYEAAGAPHFPSSPMKNTSAAAERYPFGTPPRATSHSKERFHYR